MNRDRKVLPPIYLLLAVGLMMGLHVLVPIRQLIVAPYRFLGGILLLAGFLAVLSVAGMFRRAETTIKPFESSSMLLTSGPYRFTRNPIYLCMVCGLIGIGVLLGSLTPFLIVPAFAFLIDRRFIRVEEAMLEQTFGSEYLAYKGRVRRWL